ncbi:MAG: hypothetical protein R2712_18220 [Vicinamibacterales bacterium]
MQTLVMPLRLIAGAVVIAFIYLKSAGADPDRAGGVPLLRPGPHRGLAPALPGTTGPRGRDRRGARIGGAPTGAVALWPQVEAVVTRIPLKARQPGPRFATHGRGTSLATALKKVQDAATAIDQAGPRAPPRR